MVEIVSHEGCLSMNRADAARTRIVGVDFSGGVRAGAKIWIASGRIKDGRLLIETCVPAADLRGSGLERATCLAALRMHLAGLGPTVVGLDFPFSLPSALISEPSWNDFAANFAAHYPTADAFQRESRAVAIAATGQPEPKRRTDVDARTPFAVNNLRLYRRPITAFATCSRRSSQLELCPSCRCRRRNRSGPGSSKFAPLRR